jgi:predicted amidohydrolase YtcJ
MKSFFDAGVVVTSASDYPVINPAYPLVGMQKGVIRQLPGCSDTLHNPGERVTIEQMIEATTFNEAYQMLCDDRLGSITVGKEADLVVLDQDITTCDPEHIADATVLRTMVGGSWVYIHA